MSEEVARPLFQQLMTAVEYCHSLGIANRDVKVTTPKMPRTHADPCTLRRCAVWLWC